MRYFELAVRFCAIVLWLVAAALLSNAQAQQANGKPDNATCLGCHGSAGFAIPGADGKMRDLHVVQDKFAKSVHGKRQCVECHTNITEAPHQKTDVRVSCVQCHQSLWESAKSEHKTEQSDKLGTVVQMIDRYMNSVHARPRSDDQTRTNATCYNCHDAHYTRARLCRWGITC